MIIPTRVSSVHHFDFGERAGLFSNDSTFVRESRCKMTAIDNRPVVLTTKSRSASSGSFAFVDDSSFDGRRLGTPRHLDALGRIVIPAELRKLVGLQPGDFVDLYVVDNEIVLRRVTPHCVLCGFIEHLVARRDKWICEPCLAGDDESSTKVKRKTGRS
jgi:transcriptional pleiotropic regulator of transition state genes